MVSLQINLNLYSISISQHSLLWGPAPHQSGVTLSTLFESWQPYLFRLLWPLHFIVTTADTLELNVHKTVY